MSQTRDQQAYQRGIKAARLWKRLKGTVLRWDHACVSSARKHKLPGWIGHIPMGMLAVIMLATLVFGGMVITISAVFAAALALLVSSSTADENSNNKEDSDAFPTAQSNNGFGTRYRSGPHGWGWYDSTGYMHDEDEN